LSFQYNIKNQYNMCYYIIY